MENLLCNEIYEVTLFSSMRRHIVRVLPVMGFLGAAFFNWTTGDGWVFSFVFLGVFIAFFYFVFPPLMLRQARLLWNAVESASPEIEGQPANAMFRYQLVCGRKGGVPPGRQAGTIYFSQARVVFVPYERRSLQFERRIEFGATNSLVATVTPQNRSAVLRFFLGPESAITLRGQELEATFNVPDVEMTMQAIQKTLSILGCEPGVCND